MTQELLQLAEQHNLSSQYTSEDGADSSSETLSDDEKLIKPDAAFKKLLTNTALQPSMPKKGQNQEEQKPPKRPGSDSAVTLSESNSATALHETFDNQVKAKLSGRQKAKMETEPMSPAVYGSKSQEKQKTELGILKPPVEKPQEAFFMVKE